MSKPIPVIDLFAGPGGLNEGFSRLGEDVGTPRFATIGSFEMETFAIRTLTLRAVYRHLLRSGDVPDSYYNHIRGDLTWDEFVADERVAEALSAAKGHIHQVELGSAHDNSDKLIRDALDSSAVTIHSPWVLIGGPPCQAYSLAGRSRRANDASFAGDKKHFLYREYLRIIATFAPPVFVMENVKGLLSSKNDGFGMFDRILGDLRELGNGLEYEVHSLVVDKEPTELAPGDFVIRSELYGIPQKRHRVILVGIQKGFFDERISVGKLARSAKVTVGDALLGLPKLRSGISRPGPDEQVHWESIRKDIASDSGPASVGVAPNSRGRRSMPKEASPLGAYGRWISDDKLSHVIQHEARSHMIEDLKRYWFAANMARQAGVSPKLRQFPEALQPKHKNASAVSHPFEDRFRVQVATDTSTTVVSHISKDGNYYIHPDPDQMRSLTVREAARLQTFPDNYFFVGNRTQQYHQVGNAVPPLLANQIAEVISALFADAI
jgi:DNA (cytosine-5)-methyltransferase 1